MYIRTETSDRIHRIILARPEKRNALNHEMVEELKEALDNAAGNDNVRAVIISAEGSAFSAGADLKYLQDLQGFTYEQNVEDSSSLAMLFRKMYTYPKLLVTQVDGPALAGGCGLATMADFCFATRDSKFGYTEARIGFVPAIVMIFLVRKLGEQKARELMLSADIIDAEKAEKIGLIQFVTSEEELESEVLKFTTKMIQRNSGESIRRTKQMLTKIGPMELDDALKYAAESNAIARATADCKHGIKSFLNKEKPSW